MLDKLALVRCQTVDECDMQCKTSVMHMLQRTILFELFYLFLAPYGTCVHMHLLYE